MRRIVFIGNCYASTLESEYSKSLAPLYGDVATFVSCYQEPTPELLASVSDADILVEQVFDGPQAFDLPADLSGADRVRFPSVSLNSLWPFGLTPHVRNQRLPYWQCGPYDYLMGDGFLNRKLNEGVDPDAAVDEYLALDVAKVARLDRLHELMRDRQRTRDEATGMAFADEVERRFRGERLFLNPYRPTAGLATQLAFEVYRRLGISDAAIERVTSRWVKTPFERTATPIHPRVAEHFGLAYGREDDRYLYHTGEYLTFEAYARRYVRFACNDPLLRGVATHFWPGAETYAAFQGEVTPEREQQALDDLREGLNASEGSALGECALARLLERRGDMVAALAALERAVSFDPTDSGAHESHGRLLERLGRPEEAEAAFRRAIQEDPASDGPLAALARLLFAQARFDEAAELLLAANAVHPASPYHWYDLGQAYVRLGRPEAAEAWLVRAVAALPADPHPRIQLAEALALQGRAPEAHGLLQQAHDLRPDDPAVEGKIAAARTLLTSAPAALKAA